MTRKEITLIGERDLGKTAHRGIEASLALYRKEVDLTLEFAWVPTASITPTTVGKGLRDATGIWCTPGSPYQSTAGALLAIEHARTRRIPFLGTCGGFQHALIEFARNVLNRSASHEELDPTAKDALIVQLACSLIGATAKVVATNKEQFSSILGADESIEEFNCNYGIATELAGNFDGSDLEFVAHDEAGQIRAFRLKNHPFFIGTLFQPERRALSGSLHPIVRAFIDAARAPMKTPDSTGRKKVLFVCAQNKIRSVTAEKMFAGSQIYDVKSRGVARDARIKLKESDIRWADLIFVIEKNHKNRIAKEFRSAIEERWVVCLFIEDIYEPMEESLIAELRRKLAPYLVLPRIE